MSGKKLFIHSVPFLFLSFLMILQQLFGPVTDRVASVLHVGEKPACDYRVSTEKNLAAQLIEVRKKFRVNPEEKFEVKVFMRNTGNTPWFSEDSKCTGYKMYLMTARDTERNSVFYEEGLDGWTDAKKIKMDQERINPDEIASFTFKAKAPAQRDVYREYFVPTVGYDRLTGAEIKFDTIVGNQHYDLNELWKKQLFTVKSGSVWGLDLSGAKKLLVDLSEQKVTLFLNEEKITDFRVSTGAYKTPTPVGATKIEFKQEVRVASGSTPYIMPKFMWFRKGGYGFHALPSLTYDGGRLWTEAREHIGIPVSHGCIRLLPEEADLLYEFSDVGTEVVVQR